MRTAKWLILSPAATIIGGGPFALSSRGKSGGVARRVARAFAGTRQGNTRLFLAGFVSGTVVTRGVTRRVIAAVIAHPGLVRVEIERDRNRILRLDALQREQAHQIPAGAHDRLKTPRQDFQPQFSSIVQDTRKEISAASTPEQQKKFKQ